MRPRLTGEDEDSELSLVLVNCSLENWQFEQEPEVDAVGQLLRRLQDDLELDLRARVWQPSQRALDQYATALQFGDDKRLGQAILDGFDHEGEPLVLRKNPGYELRDQSPTYTDALTAWIHSKSVDRLTEASMLEKLQQRSEQQLIQPLLKQAEAHTDPPTRVLMVGLSHVSRQLEDISAKLCAPRQRCDPRSLQVQLDYQALRAEHLALTKQQITLCQAITERSRNLAPEEATV